MAQPADKIEGEILPEAELNPLVNPLLAGHMGRWAEVYFTTPPEKRAQAVSDLVRELRSVSAAEAAEIQPSVEKAPANAEVPEPKTFRDEPAQRFSPALVESSRTCSECSAENSAQQKFCGMCGAPLQSLPHPSLPHHDNSKFSTAARASEIAPALHEPEEEDLNEIQSSSELESSTGGYGRPYHAEPTLNFGGYASRGSRERAWSVADADLPHFAVESESVPYHYRLYIGIAVALILGGLLYTAWRGKSNPSGDDSESVPARVFPAAPVRATAANQPEAAAQRAALPTDKATNAAPARTTAGASSAPSGTAPAATEPAAAKSAAAKSGGSVASQTAQPPKERAPSPRIVSVAANSSAGVSESSGAEELATAEKYLNSNRRGAGDNREAAQWLWKAVGKGNLTATMVLSDLYLRGDGIPKSCDQARLLLNVAARKGKAAAGERIRNLQAFGCQ